MTIEIGQIVKVPEKIADFGLVKIVGIDRTESNRLQPGKSSLPKTPFAWVMSYNPRKNEVFGHWFAISFEEIEKYQ